MASHSDPVSNVLPFALRADDARLNLYLDRVAGAELGDLNLQAILEEMKRRRCLMDPRTTEAIVTTLAAWRQGGAGPSTVLIAAGRPPVHGCDGRIEWSPQCDPDRRAAGADAVRVSHYDSQLVTVRAGDVIGTLHRPTKGSPGVDVFSQELPARSGKPAAARAVAGCHVDEATGKIIADVGGTLDINRHGEIRVTEGLHIPGNVDFNTGHVASPGSVQVDGNVVDLFRVDAGGDVVIRGDVHLAQVRAAGSVHVGGALATGPKGLCLAGGDVTARMIEASVVGARGTICVAREAISASLLAGGAIDAPGATLSGGVLVGRGGIVCKALGSDGQVPTLAVAGADWMIDRIALPLLAEIEKLREDLARRQPALDVLRASLKRLTHAQREQVVELEFEAQTLQDGIDKRMAAVEAARQDSQAHHLPQISVAGEVHPGVEIRLDTRLTKIDKRIAGPITFKLTDLGHGLQIVAQTAGGNVLPLRTGRVAQPLLKIDLPDLPPESAGL
ncbi:MAG: DUF342 domain-containing protein [Planctomycetes bacterium]|nr:DUF342 domain-containing protein [Planctomycetota bacterium]